MTIAVAAPPGARRAGGIGFVAAPLSGRLIQALTAFDSRLTGYRGGTVMVGLTFDCGAMRESAWAAMGISGAIGAEDWRKR